MVKLQTEQKYKDKSTNTIQIIHQLWIKYN